MRAEPSDPSRPAARTGPLGRAPRSTAARTPVSVRRCAALIDGSGPQNGSYFAILIL